MAGLLTNTGKPMVSGTTPLASSDAPAILSGSDALLFAMPAARPGVPGVVDHPERFQEARAWALNWSVPDGFAGVRLPMPWLRDESFPGLWEPAETPVHRIQRKGASGAAERTLVLTCGPNTAPISAGEPVVLFEVEGWGGGRVMRSTAFSAGQWSLPLRSKLAVSASTPSGRGQRLGRRVIEIDTGAALPPLDVPVEVVQDPTGQWSRLRLRHWAFHADAARQAMRWPLPLFRDSLKYDVLANGGYAMLGGTPMARPRRDWAAELDAFGSLAEELWRLECEGLAHHFGDTDPRRLAVELEDDTLASGAGVPASAETTLSDFWLDDLHTRLLAPGSRRRAMGHNEALADVLYPVARRAWGKDRTLVARAPSGSTVDAFRDEFDWTNPAGHNTLLMGRVRGGGGFRTGAPDGTVANLSTIADADYAAAVLAGTAANRGFKGGGFDWGVTPEDAITSAPITPAERGRRLGRGLTALSSRGLSQWVYGLTVDPHNCVGFYGPSGAVVELHQPELRPYGSRAGQTTT